MNNELPTTYPGRYGETAWSPTGQPYRPQLLIEEGEQVARRRAKGLQSNDTHRVAALAKKQSVKKGQNTRTRSIR